MEKLFSKKKIINNSKKYDIETEEHNYYANSILVHNCTGDDCSNNVIKMGYVPKVLQDKSFTGAVRGEILLQKSVKDTELPSCCILDHNL